MATQRSDATRISVTGEFDIAAVELFEFELARVNGKSPPAVVADLSGVEFMDLAALRALLRADALMRRKGRSLTVVKPPRPADVLFRLLPIANELTFVDERA